MPTVLLTEREVAKRLRMPVRSVKELRLTGKLIYIPGRPTRIFEQDLFAYLEQVRAETPAHRFIGPPTAEEAANATAAATAKATAEMHRRIRMKAFRRQQARTIKARDSKAGA